MGKKVMGCAAEAPDEMATITEIRSAHSGGLTLWGQAPRMGASEIEPWQS